MVEQTMNATRFQQITEKYGQLTIAVVGDFCLDRYLEINPNRRETSIETGLPVYNVERVRGLPGGAGTIVNNLVALGIGTILPVGFCGDDGEGYELRRSLNALDGVSLDHFLIADDRRTFTYCKPLLMHAGKPPEELNRLDSKNWTATPATLAARLISALREVCAKADAVIYLSQVDKAETGVITQTFLTEMGELAAKYPEKPMLGDARESLKGWPAVSFKMNSVELAALIDHPHEMSVDEVIGTSSALADRNGRPVFVSMAEQGIVAADPGGATEHVPALPVRGPIDVVGAGDCVNANLTSALTAGATLREALELAVAASSHIIHQLGTTGTASVAEIRSLLLKD